MKNIYKTAIFIDKKMTELVQKQTKKVKAFSTTNFKVIVIHRTEFGKFLL